MAKDTYKYIMHTEYRVYVLSEDGLMKEPMRDYYGRKEYIFCGHKTHEEAAEAILKEGNWGDYIILPVTSMTHDWGNES